MTCPSCGAHNTADAPWCTQCLQPLQQSDPPSPPGTTAPAGAPPDPPAAAPARDVAEAGESGHADDRAFRSVAGQVEWRCPSCRTWNPLETSSCAVCGQQLGASVTGAPGAASAGRVERARRLLWVAAAVGAIVLAVGLGLLVVAMRSSTGG